MKYLFIVLLYIYLAGCAKTEFNYAVVCDFPPNYSDQAWLVVSNDQGDILQKFEITQGQTQLNQRFSFQAKDAEDSYNLHLVEVDTSITIEGAVSVYSHYGVKNGAIVAFEPSQLYYDFPDDVTGFHVQITGLPAFDSLNIPDVVVNPFLGGIDGIFHAFIYDPVSQILDIDCSRSSNCYRSARQDLVLRIRPTESGAFHSLYLPAANLEVDTLVLEWNDLPTEENLQSIGLPNNDSLVFSADALDADFQHFVGLAHAESISPPKFNLPAGVNPNSLMRVRVQQGNYIRDKIFQPGETLTIEPANIDIINATLLPADVIEVETKGRIDLLGVYLTKRDAVGPYGIWYIEGEPSALKHAVLPDLSSLAPSWFSPSALNAQREALAYQYDNLNYIQLREGLPYKGNGGKFFPEARYGLKRISKTF